jgi:hypothetical protein
MALALLPGPTSQLLESLCLLLPANYLLSPPLLATAFACESKSPSNLHALTSISMLSTGSGYQCLILWSLSFVHLLFQLHHCCYLVEALSGVAIHRRTIVITHSA